MQINESATPWHKRTPPGICGGLCIKQTNETIADQQARVRFLIQSANYLGIPLSRHDLVTCLVRN